MKRKLTAGLTGASLPVFVRDTSSATGAGLASLVFNTAGLVAEYRRQGSATWTAITLVSGTLGTWASGGFVADGALAGAYEIDLPDAALASGARWVAIRLRGATNMLPVLVEIELDVVNYQSATAFITGVNSLAPPTNWNLQTINGTGQIVASSVSGNVGGVAGVTFPTTVGDATIANQTAISTKVGTPAGASVSADIAGVPVATLDLANGIEAGITLRQCMRLLTAVLAGKATDTTGTYVMKRQDGTTTAVTVVHDSAGNRSVVTIGSL